MHETRARPAGRIGKPNQVHRMRRLLLLLGCFAVLALSACGGDSKLPDPTGKGSIRAINAIKTSPDIAFLIEELTLGTVSYKSSTSPARYDDFDYAFNFEVLFAGENTRQRVATEPVKIVADRDYIFVIGGLLASPTITIWEGDERTWSGSETVFETRFGHAAESWGDIDVYLATPGIAPVLGEQFGTLALGQILPAVDIESGDKVLTLTAAGDPATVYFTSATLTLQAQSALVFSLFDADENETAPIAVRIYSALGTTSTIPDVNSPPTTRYIHGSVALGPVDIYDTDPPVTPLVAGHAFGDDTGDLPAAIGETMLTYTDANNISAVVLQVTANQFAGSRNHMFIVGSDIGSLSTIRTTPDRRPVETFAKFQLINAASNHPEIDVYVIAADSDIADAIPMLFSLPFRGVSNVASLNAGSFDLYLTLPGEKTVIAGPLRIDAALGDIINPIALDTVDPSTAQISIISAP